MTTETTTTNEGTLLEARGLFPRLSVDDRAALRPAAYAIVQAAITAAQASQALATTTPPGSFWQASVCSAVSALSAIASGVCILGASVALALTSEPDDDLQAPRAPTPDPAPPAVADGAPQPDTTTKEN